MNLVIDSDSTHKGNIVHSTPSILSANWLYLVSMVLIISIGAVLQNVSFGWGLLGTEFLLILLPTLAILRLKGLPIVQTLRLNWSGWAVMGLGLVSGVGLWLLSLALDAFMMAVFGYAPPTTPDMYPTTVGQAILAFVALAIAAPIGEETLFRGYMQRAYEGRGRKLALVTTSLLFAFFHLRLQGLVALLPIAFALGYLRMRSNSLWPAAAAHFGNNAAAALFLIIAGLQPDWLTNVPLGSPVLAFLGLILTIIALWVFNRLTTDNKPIAAAPDTSQVSRFSLRGILPLGGAALLYLILSGLEFIYGRTPELMATGPLTLEPHQLQPDIQWEYDIRNVLDESVGQATCSLTPAHTDYILQCQTVVRAFKVELPGSTYQSGDYNAQLTVQWRGDDLRLVAGEQHTLVNKATDNWRLEPAAAGLNLVTDEAGPTPALPLPPDALLPNEWPWRLMALPFTVGLSQQTNFAWPSLWQPETQTSTPTIEEMVVVVSGAEPVTTPAGNFIAWRVNLGNWTAWYDANAPHTLLRYDAGFAVYILSAIHED